MPAMNEDTIWIDSHAHLSMFEPEEILAVLERAENRGVGGVLTPATGRDDLDISIALVEDWPGRVVAAVGVHPHEAGEEGQESPERLIELAQAPEVVGIGETGLDYYYEHSPREAQQRSFRAHIEAARETKLPLIVHARDADEDTIAILKDEYAKGAYPGVIHCFTAGPALAEAALEIGFSISLAGIVTFKNAEDIRDTVRKIPLERLLIETDSPFLAPVPKRGKPNEPSYVAFTADNLPDFVDPQAPGDFVVRRLPEPQRLNRRRRTASRG